jgi:hypothetical protein
MKERPEVLREYRAKIVPSSEVEPFGIKDLGRQKKYGDEQFMFGDIGMIYVWFCFDCLEPLRTMDCY